MNAPHHPAILRIVIFVVTFLTFSRLIGCDFTWWDDDKTVSENPRLNPSSWTSVGYYWTSAGENSTMGLYVPVTYTVWNALAAVARHPTPDANGLTLYPWVFHAANILIHACTAVVVFQLLLRLIGSEVAGACGALLFALHPVQVESVGWISGTKDLLCGLLSCIALLMYVRSVQLRTEDPHERGPARRRYLIGLLCFCLAMLSKPTAVVVPLMASVIGIVLLNRRPRQTFVSLIPWYVLMIPCLIWTQKLQPAEWATPLSVWARPAVAADSITFYLCKLLWPLHLGIDYGHNPKSIAANHSIYFTWILPALLAALLYWRREKNRVVIAASLLFVLPLIPVSGLVPFEFQLISTTSDHYLYLPMLAVGLLAAWCIDRFRIPIWSIGLIVTLLGLRTVLQEPNWQDTRSLFLHALSVNPRSVAALDGLGYITARDARAMSKAGRSGDAAKLCDESIGWYSKSLVVDPNSVPSMFNLASAYKATGRTDLGLKLIQRIVKIQPRLHPGLQADPVSLAHLLIDFGDIPGAISLLNGVVERDPSNRPAVLLREQAYEQRSVN